MPSTSEKVGAVRGGVRIENLAHRYGDVTAVGPVDLDVEPGAFLVWWAPPVAGRAPCCG